MQKILFGIFAHPDDEAFGPSGTLLMETMAGTELYLMTITSGQHGTNPDNHQNLGDVRLREWHESGKLMGARDMYHLGYMDGELGNNDHVAITNEIITIIKSKTTGRTDIEIEIMTFDLNGISGHIDHIVAGRSACLAYYRLKAQGAPMKQVRMICLPDQHATEVNTEFVFMEPGHPKHEIDEIVDARHLAPQVHAIIRVHKTQRGDGEMHIKLRGDDIALNHFQIRT